MSSHKPEFGVTLMAADKLDFFGKPERVRIILFIIYGICTALLLLDFLVDRHIYHPWEALLGFYPAYGFFGCVVLVLIAKWMRTFLMRPEHFYDSDQRKEQRH